MRSQAVRLPKEFRFEGREVRVTKVGERVILEPMGPASAMPWTEIDQLGDYPFMPEAREQPEMPQDRAEFEFRFTSTPMSPSLCWTIARQKSGKGSRRRGRREPNYASP